MANKTIITKFNSRNDFLNLLQNNPGLVIMKLGAEWCGPCKRISPILEAFFATSPDTVLCADIDVDESFDLYAYLKSKKMVNGIPVILCYKKGNYNYIPNDSVTGADPVQLDAFFKRCVAHLKQVLVGNNPNKIVKTIQQEEGTVKQEATVKQEQNVQLKPNVKQSVNVKQNSIEIGDFNEEIL